MHLQTFANTLRQSADGAVYFACSCMWGCTNVRGLSGPANACPTILGYQPVLSAPKHGTDCPVSLLRFTELSTLLDPSQSKRTDKHSIVAEAIRAVTDLRSEAQRLRSLVGSLEVGVVSRGSGRCRLLTQYTSSADGQSPVV